MSNKDPRQLTPLALALALVLAPAVAPAVCPKVLTVTSKADSLDDEDGKQTLREAVLKVRTDALDCTTIRFDLPRGSVITLDETLDITDRLVEIEGPGAAALAIAHAEGFTDAPVVSIFHESGPKTTSISGLTFDGSNGTRQAPMLVADSMGEVVLRKLVFRNISVSGGDSPVMLESSGSVLVDGSQFLGNSSTDGYGGALTIDAMDTASSVQVRNSYFRGNSAGFDGGALNYIGADTPELLVRGVTFANNEAGGNGGALLVDGAPALVSNSTLSNNGAGNQGGAVFALGAHVTLNHATVVHNDANNADGALYAETASFGGTHNILSLNTAEGSDSNSLAGAAFTYSLVDKPAGKLDLGALRDNGGRTPTHLPGPGSIAIDAGKGDLSLGTATRDQRGKPRLQGDAIDIGAVETAP